MEQVCWQMQLRINVHIQHAVVAAFRGEHGIYSRKNKKFSSSHCEFHDATRTPSISLCCRQLSVTLSVSWSPG
jgi:hypothetical protein